MKILASILLLVLLCACGRNENVATTDEVITIDLLSGADEALSNLSVIAADIDYIPLQTIDSSLIGIVNKVIITEDKVYINDRNLSILCFDRKGNFINRFSRVGRGPGEYSFITDFDISPDNKKLIILYSGKLLVYNINENEFIFSKSIDINSETLKVGFIPGSDNILLSIGPWQGDEASLSLVINLEGDTLLTKTNCYKYVSTIMSFFSTSDAMQYNFDDKICFKEVFSDTIFYVNSKLNGFIPHLILDSHGTVPPPRVREDPEYRTAHANDFSSVAKVYEVPRYLYYYYMYKNTRHKIIYDKVQNIKYELDLENGLNDDLNGGPYINSNLLNCTGIYLYSSVDALDFKQYIQSDDFSKTAVRNEKKKEELKEIAGSLEDTDNPILIIVTPKE